MHVAVAGSSGTHLVLPAAGHCHYFQPQPLALPLIPQLLLLLLAVTECGLNREAKRRCTNRS